MANMVIARGLGKKYGEHTAVESLDLELAVGETLGLLGPNGAGKTTTIGMLLGLIEPSSGNVRIEGHGCPTDLSVRRQLGVAPQSLSIYNELSAEENLRFFGQLYGLAGRQLQERVQWALEFAKLEERRRDRVETFSGGMKRRLNFACALVHEPRVVFLDEPTVGVDPQSRNHIFEGIEQLQKAGLSILYTTHYMEEAQRLCNRVAIIDHGRLLSLDTVPNLIAEHGGESLIEAVFHQPPAAELPGQLEGLHWRHETRQPIEDIARLQAADIQFQSIQIRQPDLEAVFLRLTGHRLRD